MLGDVTINDKFTKENACCPQWTFVFLPKAAESCAHEICVPAAGMPPAEHENAKTRKRENAKTPSTETGKNENAKTRKRRKHNPFRSTWMLSQIWACVRYVRQQSIPYTSNTNFITALDMCKVCTEAAQSVALWTWTLSQLWACVCTEAVLPVAHFEHERYHSFGHV